MLKLGDTYEGSKSYREAAIQDALGNNIGRVNNGRGMPKSGILVTCATIFRGHTCVPCVPGAPSSENNGSVTMSGNEDAESLSSATALQDVKMKKQVRHAPDPKWLAHSISVMKAERGECASSLKRSEVKDILTTVYGFPESARMVHIAIQGQHRGVDERTVTCILQGVRELCQASHHYVEFIYESGPQVE